MIHSVKVFTKRNALALFLFTLVLTFWQLKLKYHLDDSSGVNSEENMYIEKKYDSFGKEISEFLPVKVTVYYETMCPDSRNFFVNQLLPTYEEIPQLITLDLVPYGKASTTKHGDKYEFSCQHGEGECYGNKLHACAINAITNQPVLLKVLTCMISKSFSPDDSVGTCIKPSGLDVDTLISCARSSEGDKLLNYCGERTMKERPDIFSQFIPTVLLNDDYGRQQLRLKNLRREICAQYPKNNLPNGC
ncbi:unnamed protein product [Bemisia tabaci]|uniref:Gamma-interferon-inducible lysosomal thiol reductase n=1 Tax=Bemisia tabaci TaxID=7038 RepID=A0A9P0AJW7_BEMTA|nr:unnamed protein product [Bemisia tabaci]